MNNKYFIGIDSGTTMIKAVVYDTSGNEIATESIPTAVEQKYFGWSEVNIEVEWNVITQVIKNLLGKNNVSKDDILALGINGKGCGVCFIGYDDRPVRNVILWNDSRNVETLQRWVDDGTMDEISEHGGNYLNGGEAGVVLEWIKRNEPEIMDKTKHVCVCCNYYNFKFTGNFAPSATDFFGEIGADRKISDEVLKKANIYDYRDKFLDPVHNPWEISGYVTKQAALESGLPEGIPVTMVGLDCVAACVGVGAVKTGQADIILGTSAAVMLNCPDFKPGHKSMQCSAAVPDTWVQMMAPFTGAPNNDWFVKNLSYEDKVQAEKEKISVFRLFDREIEKVNAGSDGVVFLPYINIAGERAPFLNINARGNFFGISPMTTRAALQRSLYEGVAFAHKHCFDELSKNVTDVFLSGGFSKSPVMCQIFADITNSIIKLPDGHEYGAKGVCMLAAVALGMYKDHKEAAEVFCSVKKKYEPNPKNVKIYSELFEIYKMLPPALMPAWAARADFMKNNGFAG